MKKIVPILALIFGHPHRGLDGALRSAKFLMGRFGVSRDEIILAIAHSDWRPRCHQDEELIRERIALLDVVGCSDYVPENQF